MSIALIAEYEKVQYQTQIKAIKCNSEHCTAHDWRQWQQEGTSTAISRRITRESMRCRNQWMHGVIACMFLSFCKSIGMRPKLKIGKYGSHIGKTRNASFYFDSYFAQPNLTWVLWNKRVYSFSFSLPTGIQRLIQ